MKNTKVKIACQFLFDNAQSIVTNEAAAALGLESDYLRHEMLKHPQVQYCIDCSQRILYGRKQ